MNNREQFEALPDIAPLLEYCIYTEGTDNYWATIAHSEEYQYHTNYVNGAWNMYQTLESKIYILNKLRRNQYNKLMSILEHIDEYNCYGKYDKILGIIKGDV